MNLSFIIIHWAYTRVLRQENKGIIIHFGDLQFTKGIQLSIWDSTADALGNLSNKWFVELFSSTRKMNVPTRRD